MKSITAFLLMSYAIVFQAHAALTVDRTRLIYNEGDKSVSLNVYNKNKQDPYLAQTWLENEKGEKITGPLISLPPVQRIEADARSLIRIQGMSGLSELPQDRESVFYFNVREIPPKQNKKNVLMLALQTRLKIFYRPQLIKVDRMAVTVPGTESLTLTKEHGKLVVNNPTPYHFTFVGIRNSLKEANVGNVEPVMVEPKGKASLVIDTTKISSSPLLVYVNDYGSQRLLSFSCSGNQCKAIESKRLSDVEGES